MLTFWAGVRTILDIIGIFGVVVLPLAIAILREVIPFRDKWREFKNQKSDGGKRVTIEELISLLEEGGYFLKKIALLLSHSA